MRINIFRSLIVAALTARFMLLSGASFADPFDDSLAAYDRGDYATAGRLLRPLAEQGNAQAQNALGAMYYNGKGFAQDFKEAFKWYRSAAVQGYGSAQVNLGAMYYEGHGVDKDFVRAYMWFNIAAPKGNLDAVRMRDAISNYMIEQQVLEAHARAFKCETSHYAQCD